MLTPSSNASGLSLYNELLSPNVSIIPEDLSNCSTPPDTVSTPLGFCVVIEKHYTVVSYQAFLCLFCGLGMKLMMQ